MTASESVTLLLLLTGAFFFMAGTVGLIRFPDVYTRLHALTKADNLGLGLIVAGLAIQAASWVDAVKMLLIWLLVVFASTVACHLVAQTAIRLGVPPEERP
jgi:multicomponent Na+:H+ antiporter subunit G